MKIRDVIIIGEGIAGYASALLLAKQGISVTIVASNKNKQKQPFISKRKLEEMSGQIQEKIDLSLSCSRAYEQLSTFGNSRIQSLFNQEKESDVHEELKEQLRSFDQVEWLDHHQLVELLTLDQHSVKPSDRYKKGACLGAVVYDWKNGETETLFSKETILATEGLSPFFPFLRRSSFGMELVIAQRAGARLLNMDYVQYYPLGVCQKNQSYFPLPLELLKEGGKLYQEGGIPLDLDPYSSDFIQNFYDTLVEKKIESAWLDLSLLDPDFLKERFPVVEEYRLSHGLNLSKECLPVAPALSTLSAGIAVDRTGQTSIHRLHAIGEISCTGLCWKEGEGTCALLEGLIWGVACAEEIIKQMNRLVYYFPEIKKPVWVLRKAGVDEKAIPLEEDWRLLHQIMWFYLGIRRDKERGERGKALLEQLLRFNTPRLNASVSIEQMELFYAIQCGQLITHSYH